MLSPLIEALSATDAHPDFAALLLAARARWPDFAQELADIGGGAIQQSLGYRVTGTLATVSHPADCMGPEAIVEGAHEFGEPAELLNGPDLWRLEPGLSRAVLTGAYFPNEALVEPPLVMAALAHALAKGGAQIRSGLRVKAIEQSGDGALLRFQNGEALRADFAVVSPGWAGGDAIALAPELGALFPVKGQILTVAGGAQAPRHMLRGEGVYLAPRFDGRVEIGATSEVGVEALTIDPAAIIKLKKAAGALFPALTQAQVLASRAGIRPGSPDHAPMFGVSMAGPSIFLAAGMHRNGVLLAPLAGDIIADAILGEGNDSRPVHWLTAFRAGRFDSV